MPVGPRRSRACLSYTVVLFAVASALYVSGPAIYWRIKGGAGAAGSSCPPCACDCPPPLSIENIAPGLLNLSIPDCGNDDPDMSKEMEKRFVDLLTEELQLQRIVAEENNRHMNLTLAAAKRSASQYRKEAEKCNTATETCEEARERAEEALRYERKVTTTWEQRARELGWKDGITSTDATP